MGHSTDISGEYKEIFDTVIEVIGLCSYMDTQDLTISIPFSLYWLSSGFENGYEHVLENREIVINATSKSDGDIVRNLGFLRIVLVEDRRDILEMKEKLKVRDISLFKQDEKILYLDYRIARKILIDLISYLAPASLNLITK